MTQSSPFSFENPPVVEVALGAVFKTEPPLNSAFHGLFWSKVRAEYPTFEDRSPSPALSNSKINPVELLMMPLLRKAWLINQEGSQLIQLQGDQITFNWRKGNNSVYPRFPKLFKSFNQTLEQFKEVCLAERYGTVEVQQLQLVYVNIISPSLDRPETVLVGIQTRNDLELDGINLVSSYRLPNNIHLNYVAQTVLDGDSKAIKLDISVAGPPPTDDNCDAWFQSAHDKICEVFISSTNPALHSLWGKT